jgi:hypothetical protein
MNRNCRVTAQVDNGRYPSRLVPTIAVYSVQRGVKHSSKVAKRPPRADRTVFLRIVRTPGRTSFPPRASVRFSAYIMAQAAACRSGRGASDCPPDVGSRTSWFVKRITPRRAGAGSQYPSVSLPGRRDETRGCRELNPRQTFSHRLQVAEPGEKTDRGLLESRAGRRRRQLVAIALDALTSRICETGRPGLRIRERCEGCPHSASRMIVSLSLLSFG